MIPTNVWSPHTDCSNDDPITRSGETSAIFRATCSSPVIFSTGDRVAGGVGVVPRPDSEDLCIEISPEGIRGKESIRSAGKDGDTGGD